MLIWLYYAEVGGGHKAPAKALAVEFSKKLGSKVEFTWLDIGTLAGKNRKRWFEDGYAGLIHRVPWLYALLYEVSTLRVAMWFYNAIAKIFLTKKIICSLQQEQPELIVATYFLVGPLLSALKALKLSIPVAVVVTDPYTAPPLWFYYPELTFVVASDTVKATALTAGVSKDRIMVVPQIIHVAQTNGAEHRDVKHNIPLLPEKKMVLLVGGANGFPNAEKVLTSLVRSKLDVQFVVVCGTNQVLLKKVTAIARTSDKKIVAYGYVDFLPALISLSDVVVAKAGAGVVHEVLSHQKPLIISHYVWGQEKGNKDFVVDSGLGFYEPKTKNIPRLVEECLYDEAVKGRLAKAREKEKVQNGVAEAARFLLSLV